MRMSYDELKSNAIVYTYPGGEVDIVCASNKVWTPPGWESAEDYGRTGREGPEPARREKGKKAEGEDRARSMRRARANLRRLALANGFAYFVTLTLDPDKINRYDGEAIVKRLNQWCDNMVRRHGLRYVLVPERHKDGAFHFHGFFAGAGLDVVDSGTIKLPGEKAPRRWIHEAQRAEWLQQGGHIVYNLPQWKLGFSTALALYGEYGSAVGYVCKYIGKQDGERPLGRWYYSGGDLAQPLKTYAAMDYSGLREEYRQQAAEFEIPGSKLLVIHTRNEGDT